MGSIDAACIAGFLCRLCSEMHRIVIHIYGTKGRRHGLAKKINEYLPVTVSFFCFLFCFYIVYWNLLSSQAPTTNQLIRRNLTLIFLFCVRTDNTIWSVAKNNLWKMYDPCWTASWFNVKNSKNKKIAWTGYIIKKY